MNLNTIKRGFTKTNPEKGLYNLPGVIKRSRQDNQNSSVRIKSSYIPPVYHTIGRILGITSYIVAWFENILLVSSFVLLTFFYPLVEQYEETIISTYIILGISLHILVILTDGLRNSDAPWARKSIIVFWSGIGLMLVIMLPLSLMISYL